jgi:superfamily II DNA or RNA helicase
MPMTIFLPPVYSIQEFTRTNNLVRQIGVPATAREGQPANYTGDRVRGHIFVTDGLPELLIVPPRTRVAPGNHPHVLAAAFDPEAQTRDLKDGIWLRHPRLHANNTTPRDQVIAQIASSWVSAFSYREEDLDRGIAGLRKPQLGALHAIHMHWTVTDRTATIVMPTGTGKTDTMLSILVTRPCERLFVVVPTDALRTQIVDKFLTLGVLKQGGSYIPTDLERRNNFHEALLSETAERPVVCSLEHIPQTIEEVDELVQRAQVIVTTSSIAGQCSDEIQERLAARIPYLFIDEAHHVEAPTWRRFKDRFHERHVVQFTATPFREDDQPLDGDIVYKYPLLKAQREGYFRPIRFESVLAFDPTRADQAIVAKAIERLREDFHLGHIVMARVDSITRARAVFALYQQYQEFQPVQLHTGIGKRAREDGRRKILSGESRIVVCVDMLGEGFDLPTLKIAAFHDIRKSLAVTLQLAGRFTRVRRDVGDATFIANVADVNVREELQKLYTRDPDWNVLLPQLNEQFVGGQTEFQDFLRGFNNMPEEIDLRSVRPAMSAVVYRTRCADWIPHAFLEGIPDGESCERIYHSINAESRTMFVVTGKQMFLDWADSDSMWAWQWDLYIAIWSPGQNLLYINGSSNASDFRALASALTGNRATLIRGQDVFRVFAGINRLRLQNVGLTEHIGRNVRYIGRMGADVEPRVSLVQRANAQKAVLAGSGFENGAAATIGASQKGRIWSHQRDRINKFRDWCLHIGNKLINAAIDPDTVLQGTLQPDNVAQRPAKRPLYIDWPEEIYTEFERAWTVALGGTEYPLSSVSLELINPAIDNRLLFALVVDDDRAEFELELFDGDIGPDFVVRQVGERAAAFGRGARGVSEAVENMMSRHPPKIWFIDGSSLEGSEYIEPRVPHPPFRSEDIRAWDWTGIDITKESQGDQREQDSVQARVIQVLWDEDYEVIFDDDSSGEIADVVAIRAVGGLDAPTAIEIDLYHCKFSHGTVAGARVADLYELCGQAQKCIWWAASPMKKTDLFTHLMRRESTRVAQNRPTRIQRGTLELLQTIREMSRVYPVNVAVNVVQPGLSRTGASRDQLQLLGATANHLTETYQLPFHVIGNV